jgi:hypothetical protein
MYLLYRGSVVIVLDLSGSHFEGISGRRLSGQLLEDRLHVISY